MATCDAKVHRMSTTTIRLPDELRARIDRLADDLARIAHHLRLHQVEDVEARVAEVLSGLEIPGTHPLIGRKVARGRRELVIGRGNRGHVALYACDAVADMVSVAGLRAQREAGFDG